MNKLATFVILLATIALGVGFLNRNLNVRTNTSANLGAEQFPLVCNDFEQVSLKLESDGLEYGIYINGVREFGIENNFVLNPVFDSSCNLIAFSVITDSSSSRVDLVDIKNRKLTSLDLWDEYKKYKGKTDFASYSNIYTVFESWQGENLVVKVLGRADNKTEDEIPVKYIYNTITGELSLSR